jgi:hypothetical protein
VADAEPAADAHAGVGVGEHQAVGLGGGRRFRAQRIAVQVGVIALIRRAIRFNFPR